MNISIRFSDTLTNITKYSVIFLFTYTAFDKLMHMMAFVGSIQKSPIIPLVLSEFVAYSVICIEIAIIALFLSKFKKLGFLTAALLLLMFNVYITLMLLFSPFLPCSCGGVISSLSWTQHLIFNSMFMVLSYWSYVTERA